MTADSKYAAGDVDRPPKRTVGDNLSDCRCETCRPSIENVVYTLIILGLGAGAVVGGTYAARASSQSIEDFNFNLKDAAGAAVSMMNLITMPAFEVASIFIPAGDMPNFSNTQTIYDFKEKKTVILDVENKLCFIHSLNTTGLQSFKSVKDAIVQRKGLVNTATTASATNIQIENADYVTVRKLGNYLRERCETMKKIFSVKPGPAAAPPSGSNCTDVYLPRYEVVKDANAAIVHITQINKVMSCSG